jgi:hypothetical protein
MYNLFDLKVFSGFHSPSIQATHMNRMVRILQSIEKKHFIAELVLKINNSSTPCYSIYHRFY